MTMNTISNTATNQIIEHLQRHGQATLKELERLLDLSTTAAREQIVHLQRAGLVTSSTARRGQGRPHNVYVLTDKARNQSPKSYDTLIATLLCEIAAEEGVGRLKALLERVSQRLADQYAVHITGDELAQRMIELRGALEQRGIPADVSPQGDSITLFTCPYFGIVQEHPEVCAMERQMLERVIGGHVVLEQSIRQGFHSCRFAVHTDSNDINV